MAFVGVLLRIARRGLQVLQPDRSASGIAEVAGNQVPQLRGGVDLSTEPAQLHGGFRRWIDATIAAL